MEPPTSRADNAPEPALQTSAPDANDNRVVPAPLGVTASASFELQSKAATGKTFADVLDTMLTQPRRALAFLGIFAAFLVLIIGLIVSTASALGIQAGGPRLSRKGNPSTVPKTRSCSPMINSLGCVKVLTNAYSMPQIIADVNR